MTWIRGGPTSLDIRNIKEAIDNRLVYFTTKPNTTLFILILLGSGLEAQEFMIAGFLFYLAQVWRLRSSLQMVMLRHSKC
ncbi:hypothetical protein Hanom_Chr05g00455291 [Helianthus anomalus]